MKPFRKSSASQGAAGFVETLIVLAAMAAIGTVVVPNVSLAARDAQLARDRNNARIFVAMANSALTAGYQAAWARGDDVVRDLLDGVKLPDQTSRLTGPDASDLSHEEVTGAARHITVNPTTRQVTFSEAPVPDRLPTAR